MDPIDLFRKLFLYTITLAQTIGTGSLGDAYHLTLQSCRPQRVNWIDWDAARGFGPNIVFEAYTQHKTSEF